MLYTLASPIRIVPLLLALASCIAFSAPLQAEPVVNDSAQQANRLIDASQWLPGAHALPSSTSDSQAGATAPAGATAARPAPLSQTAGRPIPLTDTSERSTTATLAPSGRETPTNATAPKVEENTLGREIRGAVKDAVRPLYEDLSTSDAAQALRELQAELHPDKNQAFGAQGSTQTNRQEGAGTLDAAKWDGQANREPPRTEAQVERDKVLASVMMDKLIDEVTPWAVGLLALYALFYLVKLALAYSRLRSYRRRQGSLRRSRHKTTT